MKKYLLPLALFLAAAPAFAQQRTCGTPILPLEYEDWIQQKIAERFADPNSPQATYTIPCIVHIINNGESVGSGSNISQTQVNSQFDVLNEDYNKTNPDFATVCPSVFQSVAANCQITWCKALRDPNGNTLSEPGIDRINRNTMGWSAPPYSQSYIDATIKPASIWDPTRYCNIWVCNLGNQLLGYATFPSNSTLAGLFGPYGTATTDGVVILYNAFGRVGNVASPYNKGRSATHELGHWLGLRHIWGDATCGNDYCADTPTQNGPNYAGCPSFPSVTCTNGPNGDMWVNYMDYVTDACMVMFTNNQKTRMQTAMQHGTYRLPLQSSFVCSPLSTGDIDAHHKFDLYPNPTAGRITIDPLDMGGELTVKVYDIVGNLVKEMKMENNAKFEVDLTDKQNGAYFIELSNSAGRVTQKFNLVK
ncbi:MAG TPA: M43 family zinc metalloprotease [Bacteroidia bacterium]